MDPLCEKALELAAGRSPTAREIQRVADQTSSEAAAWAFGQWDLRARAKSKFKLAEHMLFTREALEQATNEALAAYHARLFPAGSLVVDLTAGIGADLIALARRGPTVGFELDEERAEYTQHNLVVHGLDAKVNVMDSSNAFGHEFAYADPARRVESRRTLDPSLKFRSQSVSACGPVWRVETRCDQAESTPERCLP